MTNQMWHCLELCLALNVLFLSQGISLLNFTLKTEVESAEAAEEVPKTTPPPPVALVAKPKVCISLRLKLQYKLVGSNSNDSFQSEESYHGVNPN